MYLKYLNALRFFTAADDCFRLIWIVLILISLGLFLYLVVTKVNLMNSHQRNVNIDVFYNDTIQFPTVTICNQNPFRYIVKSLYFTPVHLMWLYSIAYRCGT